LGRDPATSVERIVPTWLSSGDEVWLAALVAELDALVGEPASSADDRVRDVVGHLARRHGAGMKQALGAWTVERRRWKSRVASPVPPPRIREVLFASRVGRSRGEALAESSRVLGLSEATIEECLFADRAGARRLVPPTTAATPRELVDRYNLALAQALLMRSTRIVALVKEHARSAVRYAKLRGLMATFEARDEGTVIELSGPLALFHETTKYGHALAGFLAALAVTPAWSLRAELLLRGERHELVLDATAPLPRTHALPAAADSEVERRLAIDLRRLRSGWEISREDTVVRVGRRLFFPDFTLVAPEGRARVLVEIVGYWDPDYLAKKIEALAAVRTPIVVCVDERHATGALAPRHDVLAYRKGRVDAAALVAAAERLTKDSSRDAHG